MRAGSAGCRFGVVVGTERRQGTGAAPDTFYESVSLSLSLQSHVGWWGAASQPPITTSSTTTVSPSLSLVLSQSLFSVSLSSVITEGVKA